MTIRQRKAMFAKLRARKSFVVLTDVSKIQGIRFMKGSIIRLIPSVAKFHLIRKNIKQFKK